VKQFFVREGGKGEATSRLFSDKEQTHKIEFSLCQASESKGERFFSLLALLTQDILAVCRVSLPAATFPTSMNVNNKLFHNKHNVGSVVAVSGLIAPA
jgi:hypothetical protein